MKIKHKFKAKNWTLILIFLGCCQFISAQGFKGIVPLESTCEDIKRILRVEKCDFPQSIYRLKEYTVSVSFYENKPIGKNKDLCYQIPAGRVIGLTVSYNKHIRIAEFEYELKFAQKLNNDIDTEVYKNEANNVSVFSNNGLVETAIFSATRELHKKYAIECRKSAR